MTQKFSWAYTQIKENTDLKSICPPMFTALLLTITKIWKQSQYLSTDEWIKK